MIDMQAMIDGTFQSTPYGGVFLVSSVGGDYSGPGGKWVPASEPKRTELKMVNIQPLNSREASHLANIGTFGHDPVINVEDYRIVHINDGNTYLTTEDNGISADYLEFSDGIAVRQWRVIQSDNRPWHNFSRLIVQRYRGEG